MAANATANVAAPINTSTMDRRQCGTRASLLLGMEGRLSPDRTALSI
jgi:hypothetical protein